MILKKEKIFSSALENLLILCYYNNILKIADMIFYNIIIN